MKKHIIAYILSFTLVVISCTRYESPQLEELGFAGKGFGDRYSEIIVGNQSGECEVPFYSSCVVQLEVVEGEQWLRIDSEKSVCMNDGLACLNLDPNKGYPRLGLVELSAEGLSRRDTLRVMQGGRLEPRFAFYESEYLLNGGGEEWIELDSNVPERLVSVNLTYRNQSEDWVTRAYVTGRYLVLKYKDKTATAPRSVFVTLRADDGWGGTLTAIAEITHKPNN